MIYLIATASFFALALAGYAVWEIKKTQKVIELLIAGLDKIFTSKRWQP